MKYALNKIGPQILVRLRDAKMKNVWARRGVDDPPDVLAPVATIELEGLTKDGSRLELRFEPMDRNSLHILEFADRLFLYLHPELACRQCEGTGRNDMPMAHKACEVCKGRGFVVTAP